MQKENIIKVFLMVSLFLSGCANFKNVEMYANSLQSFKKELIPVVNSSYETCQMQYFAKSNFSFSQGKDDFQNLTKPQFPECDDWIKSSEFYAQAYTSVFIYSERLKTIATGQSSPAHNKFKNNIHKITSQFVEKSEITAIEKLAHLFTIPYRNSQLKKIILDADTPVQNILLGIKRYLQRHKLLLASEKRDFLTHAYKSSMMQAEKECGTKKGCSDGFSQFFRWQLFQADSTFKKREQAISQLAKDLDSLIALHKKITASATQDKLDLRELINQVKPVVSDLSKIDINLYSVNS